LLIIIFKILYIGVFTNFLFSMKFINLSCNLVKGTLLGALCLSIGFISAAEPYPSDPVRLIVPFPAGGGVDAAGRLLAQKLTESFGKPFVVDNRGGANGNIGTEAVAKAPNNGYTLLFTGAGFVTNPSLYKKIPYDPIKSFEPISLMAIGPNVLVVHPSLPVQSVGDLIALAKSKPGQIGFAGSGNGSTPHLAGILMNHMANVEMLHVPYRGSGPAITALLAGEAPVMFLPAINAVNLISSGRVRGIAVTSTERLVALPNLPTVASTGLAGYESSQWYGVLAPAGTSSDILELLNSRISKIMQSPEIQERMKTDGLVVMAGPRDQFTKHIRSELIKWSRVITVSGATID
jgi:tripartite-type tricarboxylate transporter receptor subunit TctC